MILQGVNIHFSYPGETIFSGFNFKIEKGERVVIRGESGSGKSTLFRLILGFEKPDKGEILFNDKPLTRDYIKTIRKQSAWLPQDLNLGEGTVEDVMTFPFTFKQSHNGVPDKRTKLRVMKDLGLEEELFQKKFPDLSTGQRQRIGIALCILLDKPILLLDEPTSALDEASKEKAFQYLTDMDERTILSTSHDPWWIDRCDHVIDIDND